jgi:hypothetical protein
MKVAPLLLLVASGGAACGLRARASAGARDFTFADVSASSGALAPVSAVAERTFDLELQDFDGDGDLDLFVADHHGQAPMSRSSRLLRNDGGHFTDVTDSAFADVVANPGRSNVQDALAVDVTGDGLPELFTTSNDGVGWALTSTAPLRFSGFSAMPGWNGYLIGRGIAAGDLDGDGDLDLFISRHGGPPMLLRNDGKSFKDVTRTLPTNLYSSIQPYLADFDGDGKLDLLTTAMVEYVRTPWPAGVTARAHLLIGRGDGSFVDATDSSGIGAALISCAIAVGDVDNDGDLDLFQIGVPHDPERHAHVGNTTYAKLLINDGHGHFSDATARASGLPKPASGGPTFWEKGLMVDLDNDGWQDLVVVRGGPHVWRNLGGLRFQEVHPAGFDFTSFRSVAAGDFDGDGDVDLVFTVAETGIKMFANRHDAPAGAPDWLRVTLAGPPKNRLGIGAAIAVYDAGHAGDANHLRGYRQVLASSNHHLAYAQLFGVPPGGRYDVRVTWPGPHDDLSATTSSDVAAGSAIVVSHGQKGAK